MESNKAKNSKIENLRKDADRYRKKPNYNSYMLLGGKLKEIYFLTKDSKVLDECIEVYTDAIKFEEKSEAYCHRADLYSLKNDHNAAVADFKRANEIYEPSGNYCEDLNMKHHLESISQLQGVKDTIAKLKEEGKMDADFLESYDKLCDSVMQVSNRVRALELKDEVKDKQIAEMQEQIKELLERQNNSLGNNEELEKIKKEMATVVQKVGEISMNVDLIMS